MNWGLAEECIPPKDSAGKRIRDLVILRKKYLGVCQLSISKIKFSQFNQKMISNLFLDLFYWTEGWPRSVFLLIGYASEGIFDLVVLRKST